MLSYDELEELNLEAKEQRKQRVAAHKIQEQRIKYLAHKTFTRGVLSEIGGFGGLFAIDKTKYTDPVLVSSVDGVGTKLKIAFEMNLHSTVGADLVNHCVNDIAVQGAAPMFFMRWNFGPVIAILAFVGVAIMHWPLPWVFVVLAPVSVAFAWFKR